MVSGYKFGSGKSRLSKEQVAEIERSLPSPHDPDSQSLLYLEGHNKLKMEAEAAKNSSHLVVLSNNANRYNNENRIQEDMCLIEQEPMDSVTVSRERRSSKVKRLNITVGSKLLSI